MLRRTDLSPNFLRSRPLAAALLAMMLLAAGCGGLPSWMGGGGRSTMNLDDGDTFAATLEPGDELALTMRQPNRDGDAFEGAVFDPAVLDLSGFLLQPGEDADAPGRAVYIFRALAAGETTVEIRIRRPREPGSMPEVYKTVKVAVEK